MNRPIVKTWKKVAEAIGVTPQTLSKWRRESDDCPQTKDLEAWDLWSASRANSQERGESEATETLIKLLTPLRRLLDALPRQVASQANPANPNIAELAIRNGLDDRVFSEIEKLFLDR